MTSLKKLRQLTGKSRAKVAAELGMSERHLYRIENGVSPLTRLNALRFAEHYGVTLNDIDEAKAA